MTHWLDRIDPQPHHVWQRPWTKGTVEPPRVLCDHELVVVSRGCCVVELESVAHELAENDFIIIPPGVPHMTRAVGEVSRHCVHFDWVPIESPPPEPLWFFLPGTPPRGWERPPPAFVEAPRKGSFSSAVPVVSLFQSLGGFGNTRGVLSRNLCRATLLELLTRLLAPVESGEERQDKAGMLAYEIRGLLDEAKDAGAVNIRKLLKGGGYSYEHMSRLFTAKFGIPPLRYVIYSRMERAKLLLRDSRLTVAEVAYEVGYEDPAYFIRAFRKLTGMTPGAYAKSR